MRATLGLLRRATLHHPCSCRASVGAASRNLTTTAPTNLPPKPASSIKSEEKPQPPAKKTSGETLQMSYMMSGLSGLAGVAGISGGMYKEHSGIIWFSGVFPLRIHRLDFRFMLRRYDAEKVLKSLNKKVFVRKVVVSAKDGGLLVYFTCQEADTQEVLNELLELMRKDKSRSILSSKIDAFLVRGKPFIEDMQSAYPSLRILIQYSRATPLSEETLYKEFRKYGEIHSITSKGGPVDGFRTAYIQFRSIRAAVAARNCMHGASIGEDPVKLYIRHDTMLDTSGISDWFSKHTKLLVPVVLGIVALITYIVIDPLRVFFITNHITKRFSLKLGERSMQLFAWLRAKATGSPMVVPHDTFEPVKDGQHAERRDLEQIKMLLRSDAGSILFLTGTPGSGQSHLVERALEGFKNVLYIDMKRLNALHDDDFIAELITQMGCFPGFGFSNFVTHVAELAGFSAKGIASSTTLEGKITQILHCLEYALQSVYNHSGIHSPLNVPVVVFDGLDIEHIDQHDKFYSRIIGWAGHFSGSRCSHILFTSDSQVHDDVVQKTMLELDKKVQTVALSDASVEEAVDFVNHHLPEGKFSEADVVKVVSVLGGRYSDLQLLVRKVQYGLNLQDAADDMVERAMFQVRRRGFGERQAGGDSKDSELPWTKSQFWLVLEKLAVSEAVPYDEIVFNPLFKGDATRLHAMVRADLITVVDEVGKPKLIRASRPLYRSAFARMLESPSLGSGMRITKNYDLIAMEQAKVDKYLKELNELQKIEAPIAWWLSVVTFGIARWFAESSQIRERRNYLVTRMGASHRTIAKLTAESKAAAEVLQR